MALAHPSARSSCAVGSIDSMVMVTELMMENGLHEAGLLFCRVPRNA